MKWEYKRVIIENIEETYYDGRTYRDISDYWDDKYMNELGMQGWELVSVYKSLDPDYGLYAIFKREVL